MNRIDRLTVAMCIAALIAVILMGASQYASGQVPIYTRPSANISGTSPTGVTFDASDVFQAEDSLTAFATGGQTNATAMSATKSYHRFSTVATAGDSGKLPAATVGQSHYVRNDGAAAMQVFGAGTDTINGVATATGISQGAGMGVWYICTTAGAWTTSPVSTITATTKLVSPTLDTGGNNTLTLGANATASNIIFGSGGGVNPTFQFQTVNTTRVAFTSGINTQGTQIRTAQSNAPTCSSNCGTSPSVAGTDTAMTVTMGASGVPASGWVVTFNGTWVSAPACQVASAVNTMVVGKMAIAVVTTTTTVTVTTNGTAPGNSDKYHILCVGIS